MSYTADYIQRVLILAGDTDGNIGDRAIVLATCDELKKQYPKIDITIISGNPDKDKAIFGANTIPRGIRGFSALLNAARHSDVVLCGGGGLFQDDTSLIKMPYWTLRLSIIRILASDIIGYSIGVGPLNYSVSRIAARLAFACMKAVSVRDHLGYFLAKELSSKPVTMVPDPALMLLQASREDAVAVLQNAGIRLGNYPLVGVVVRRSFHQRPSLIPHKYAVKYNLRKIPGKNKNKKMINLLAETLDRLSEQKNASILFLPTYNVSHEGDDKICEQIIKRMKTSRHVLLHIDDPRLYKAVTACLSVLIGGRMHPTIFAAAMGTPIVGLSYNQKFEGFFRLIGQEEKVISIDDFVDKEMVHELVDLVSAGINEEKSISQKIADLILETRLYTQGIVNKSLIRGDILPS